jgi:hypothetical protein
MQPSSLARPRWESGVQLGGTAARPTLRLSPVEEGTSAVRLGAAAMGRSDSSVMTSSWGNAGHRRPGTARSFADVTAVGVRQTVSGSGLVADELAGHPPAKT